jgi:uncharacterized membrane protein YfcA
VIVVAIVSGLLIGVSLGALGGGGSILTVPALVYLLDQSPHAATTGSLLIVGISALAGMSAHWRAGRVRVAQGVVFGVLGVAGSYAGARLSANVSPDVLLTAFAVLMLVAAAAMLRRRGVAPRSGSAAASGARVCVGVRRARVCVGVRRSVKVLAAATAVGLLTGFFGVGGGFVIVPALVLALGFEMPVAVGTSLLVIAINSAAALAARLGDTTRLDWPLLGLFTVAAIAGSLAGNRIAGRVDARRLTAAFTVLLTAIAVYSLWRSVPGLM